MCSEKLVVTLGRISSADWNQQPAYAIYTSTSMMEENWLKIEYIHDVTIQQTKANFKICKLHKNKISQFTNQSSAMGHFFLSECTILASVLISGKKDSKILLNRNNQS